MEQLRILIIDDEYLVGSLLKSFAMEYGTPDLICNGWDALKAFRLAYEEGRPYDFVFLDLWMPGLDGQATLKALREYESSHHPDRKADCKIIMITASREPNDILEAYKNQCNGFLSKPLTEHMIQEVLRPA